MDLLSRSPHAVCQLSPRPRLRRCGERRGLADCREGTAFLMATFVGHHRLLRMPENAAHPRPPPTLPSFPVLPPLETNPALGHSLASEILPINHCGSSKTTPSSSERPQAAKMVRTFRDLTWRCFPAWPGLQVLLHQKVIDHSHNYTWLNSCSADRTR